MKDANPLIEKMNLTVADVAANKSKRPVHFIQNFWHNREVSNEADFLRGYREHSFVFAIVASWAAALIGTILTVDRLFEARLHKFKYVAGSTDLSDQVDIATKAFYQELHTAPLNLALYWIPPLVFSLAKTWSKQNYQWVLCAVYLFYYYLLGKGVVDGTRSMDKAHVSFILLNVFFIVLFRTPFRHALVLAVSSDLIISTLMIQKFGGLHVISPIVTVWFTAALCLYLSWCIEERERTLYETGEQSDSRRLTAQKQAKVALAEFARAEEQARITREQSTRAEEQALIAREESKRAETAANQLSLLNSHLKTLHEQRELLIRGLHHDANQPLSTMSNLLYSMEMRANGDWAPLQKPFRLDIEILVGEAQKLRSILAGMYELVTLGEFTPHYVPVSTNSVLRQIQASFCKDAEDKNLKLIVRTRKVDVFVWTDSSAIVRMLSNLVSNAIKYTIQGSVIVGSVKHGNMLRIDVRDTGVGIPKEAKDKIYKEFTRLEQSGVEGEKGLGLGLAIVNLFREKLLGHYVDHYSVVGRGTRFSVDMPIAQRTIPSDAAKSLQMEGIDVSRLYVVVVEDNDRLRESIKSLMLVTGYVDENLRFMSSKKELERFLDRNSHRFPNAVISDFRLGNGETANDVIRVVDQVFDYVTVPVIIYSAEIQPKIEGSRKHVHIVVKSGEPMELLSAINTAVNSARLDEEKEMS